MPAGIPGAMKGVEGETVLIVYFGSVNSTAENHSGLQAT
jgi:hypothetical protein